MNKILIATALAAAFGAASAKLPPPDDATKAKAAEAAAKAAWQGKVDAFLLCKAQDRVAAAYHKASGTPAKGSAPAAAQPVAAAASKPASAAAGTPVVSSVPPPCADPGPFAYNAPAQTPLETSGAHSPAGNAASPPSVRANSAQMAPAAPKK